MKEVLIACERSGIVREAFNAYPGIHAISCDLEPPEDGRISHHYQGDVRDLLNQHWDLMIAHPECRYLSNSGVLRLYKDGKKRNGPDSERWEEMRAGALFFKLLWDAPIDKIAIENPIIHGYAKEIIGREQSQMIQPWEFGEDASKGTCLWLKGLPRLRSTKLMTRPVWIPCPEGCDDYFCQRHLVHTADCECPELDDWVLRGDDPYREYYANQTPSGQNKLGPSPKRAMERARTYPGVAQAMAAQWVPLL